MTVDEIRELIALATETGIAELEVQRGDNRVRIRRASFAAPQEIVVAAPSYAAASAPASAGTAPPSAHSAMEAPKEKGEKPHDPNLVLVKSPIVGTFYEAASPEAPALRPRRRTRAARQGALHHREHEADERDRDRETSGIIESKLVMNGQPVEYGEALFAVRTV